MADQEENADAGRMSFGDHLDDLRVCLIRALMGVALGTVLTLVYGKEILGLIFKPLLLVQSAHGLPMELQALAPMAGFAAYLKIAFLSGLILTMPWVIYQIWRFVTLGLYVHERRFVRSLLPASVGLFVLGVLFLYFIVLPLVLHFFIAFNRAFDFPDVRDDTYYSWLLPTRDQVGVEPESTELTTVPVLANDPPNPAESSAWINGSERRLKVATEDGVWSVPLEPDDQTSPIHSQFAIDFYISFVLMLALAFGIAFELPIVVFFLAWTGIVPTAVMARWRRYVLFGIIVSAAIMTPPDVISQLLLAVPMYALFEVGLLVGKLAEKRAAQKEE